MRSMAGPLGKHSVFPPMVVQMIAVGEDTGALDAMLDKVSDFYDQEVESTTESLTCLDRADHDRGPRRHRRSHGHRPVHADVQDLRPDQVGPGGLKKGPPGVDEIEGRASTRFMTGKGGAGCSSDSTQ